jgi:N-acetylglucosaminyldiphosphoundecaprenol N-acetyl-beta-D-mannosaminyltransferase
MRTSKEMPVKPVIGFSVTCLSFKEQIDHILEWASDRVSKVVCVANVHMLMEAHRSNLDLVLRNADMVTPDGMPLVWMLRLLGVSKQERVAGPDMLRAVCEAAQQKKVSVFFLGSEFYILERIQTRLNKEFPNLNIAAMEPLPFRPLTPAEDEAIIQKVNQSGAGIVLLSLGCPKQEYWMHDHKDRINAVMIGLGGAFSMFAGIHKRAPQWIQSLGFEWLYRLLQEPRRLWKRYVLTIPPFIFLALVQLCSTQLLKDGQWLREKV